MIIPLNEPIQCERLCNVIQKIIAKYNDENGRQAPALSINVVEISDSTVHTPKLEHKDV